MWICKSCNAENQDSAQFCQGCGIKYTEVSNSSFQRTGAKPNIQGANINRNPIVSGKKSLSLSNYIKLNETASTMDMIGSIFIALAILITIASFFFIGLFGNDGFGFFRALFGALAVFLVYILPGLLLKALANIWQNTENTVALLHYQIDLHQEDQ